MRKPFLIPALFILIAAAASAEPAAQSANLSDSELTELAYSETEKYPPGFYHEEFEGDIFYEHAAHKPLFTDDKDEALRWSEASGKSGSESTELTEPRETDKYFEFKRVNPLTGQILLSRVHKASYYEGCYPYNCPQKDNVELAGHFRLGTITKDTVKEFTEYLWFIKYWNYSGPKVLSSRTQEVPDGFTQTIVVLNFGKGDWGLPDSIGLSEEIFYIDKRSGEVRRRFKTIKSVTGRYNKPPGQNL